VGKIYAGEVNHLRTPLNLGFQSFDMPTKAFSNNRWVYHTPANIPDAFMNIKNGDTIIGDFSVYRYSPTGVGGIGNVYEGRENEYYLYSTKTKIEDSTNLSNYHLAPTETNFSLKD
jgi:hypothetical protein